LARNDLILVVDDDPEIRDLLQLFLTRHGYRVRAVPDGSFLESAIETPGQSPDLIILDLMLPNMDGLSWCQWLRERSPIPVLMLTARGSETDRIVGLETGADDYLPKPFHPEELLARIRSVLRRTRAFPDALDSESIREFRFGEWRLLIGSRELIDPQNVRIALSGAEYRLLRIFLERAQTVIQREVLTEMLWSRSPQSPTDRSLDIQVSRLRHRLRDDGREPKLIRTVRGEGYLFTLAAQPSR
jgi:two-component system OmpR family response regulator